MFYSGLNLKQDKATKPQTVQIVRQGKATPYWFKFNPLYLKPTLGLSKWSDILIRQPIFFSDGIANLSLTCVQNKAVNAKPNSVGVPAT